METMAETPSRTASVRLPAAGGGASASFGTFGAKRARRSPVSSGASRQARKKSRPVRALPNRMAPV